MIGSDKDKELVPKGGNDTFSFFDSFPHSPFSSISPFSGFDNYISDIMHRHNRWYEQEFERPWTYFDPFFRDPFFRDPFFKDPSMENRIDHSFFNTKKVPLDLKEFYNTRPTFFPSSFMAPTVSPFTSSRFFTPFSSPLSSFLSRAHPGCSNMNMVDKDGKIEITLKTPGLSKENLEIDVDNDKLNIKGMRTDEFEEKGDNNSYHFKEKKMSCFQQSIRLPENADPDKVKATLKDGILKIHVDKLDHPEKKKVEIQ